MKSNKETGMSYKKINSERCKNTSNKNQSLVTYWTWRIEIQ